MIDDAVRVTLRVEIPVATQQSLMTIVLGPIHTTITPFKVSAVLSGTGSRNVLLDTRSYCNRKRYMLPCCEAILCPSETGCQGPRRCRGTWENSFIASPSPPSEARPYWYSGNIRHSTRHHWYVEITDLICLTISQPKPHNTAKDNRSSYRDEDVRCA